MNWKPLFEKANRNLSRWEIIRKDKRQQTELGEWLFSLGVDTGAYPLRNRGDNHRLGWSIPRKRFAAGMIIQPNNVFEQPHDQIEHGTFTSRETARIIALKQGLYYVRRQAKQKLKQTQTA